MWPEDYWPDDYWDADFWPKEGAEPPVGGDEQPTVGLGHPKAFSPNPELGGGGW